MRLERTAIERLRRVLPLLVLLGFPGRGSACDIPVFQYALDYWEPDVFEVLVHHRGEVGAEGLGVIKKFEESEGAESSLHNYTFDTLDVGEVAPGEMDAETADSLAPGESVVVVHSPSPLHRQDILWRGPLSEETFSTIADSPLRRKIGEQLSGGTSAVWILLESGDAQKDRTAFDTLEKELPGLANTLELPGEPDPANPTRLSFDIERLSRNDTEELFLIEMLLSTEPDLKDPEFEGLPMAFPVFGRGRVLYALIGEGINADTIREACEFLTGACSCEIKDLNPGADLLLAMDWKSAVAERVMEMEEEKVLSDSTPASHRVDPPAAAVAEPVVKNLTLVVSILMGIVAVGTLALFWKGQSS